MSDNQTEDGVISFEKAIEQNMYARRERKFEKARKAFKAVIRKKLKRDRLEAKKQSKKKGRGKRTR